MSGPRPTRLTMRWAATSVVRRLQKAGFDAMFAGGCVRDMLMRTRPADYDVATSARPEEVVRLFHRTQRVGAKFGVVLVRVGRFAVETATFRSDADYEDGRHPTAVRFTDAREDAFRRDFTINGMFYDPIKRQTVDYVGGKQDLQDGIIRAIGDPRCRFAEDHLRILRAVRFASRFAFKIESTTWEAMSATADSLPRISPERIRIELELMMTASSRARAFGDFARGGILPHLWTDASLLAEHAPRIEEVLDALPRAVSFEVALAAFLHPLTIRHAAAACDALRCSNLTRKAIVWLLSHQDDLAANESWTDADLKLLMASPFFDALPKLCAAKLKATGQPPTVLRQTMARIRRFPPAEVSPPPLLNGDDLATMGVPAGPRYKAILERVYYAQLNGEIATAREAKAMAQSLLAARPDRPSDAP